MTTTPADPAVDSPSKRRWPESKLKRIAASVAIGAALVAVVAAIFTGGVIAGLRSSNVGGHDPSGPRYAMSAQREGTPSEQIWIIPGSAAASGFDGYIVT